MSSSTKILICLKNGLDWSIHFMHLWMKQSPCWDRTGSGVIEKFQCSFSLAVIINPAALIGLINHSFLSIGWHLHLFYVSFDAQWQSWINNGGMWCQETALNCEKNLISQLKVQYKDHRSFRPQKMTTKVKYTQLSTNTTVRQKPSCCWKAWCSNLFKRSHIVKI